MTASIGTKSRPGILLLSQYLIRARYYKNLSDPKQIVERNERLQEGRNKDLPYSAGTETQIAAFPSAQSKIARMTSWSPSPM
ncbi:unnamed protein product [Pieris brassicae]|uniref:Uncharacterized protein n=1 Tax=Pieris brassicae TaxID=7116 RepID=A0A9P0SJN8_PIEBR|nr:unnamed protein product [Pieris brassicae]